MVAFIAALTHAVGVDGVWLHAELDPLPFPSSPGFYLQPWLGVSTTLWRSAEPRVGAQTYDPLPVQLFATVNLGWELAP